jgi:NADH:ubiquinone oxidoreductase subunit 4 (subunit M)
LPERCSVSWWRCRCGSASTAAPRLPVRRVRALDRIVQVNYHLGIDGISLLLILLNCFTTVLVVIAGWQS